MTERAPKLTLTYFTYSATAETLRLAAAIGKVITVFLMTMTTEQVFFRSPFYILSTLTAMSYNIWIVYCIVLFCFVWQIPFTNKAIDYEEWEPPSGDRTNPRYQLPVLEIEEKGKEVQYIAQTSAILHYLGKRGGLYPPDSLEALQVEYMLETVSEALKPLEMSESGGVLSDNPWTEEELLRVRDRIANDSVCGLPHVSTKLVFF